VLRGLKLLLPAPVADNVLGLIGNTPLVRLNRVTKGIKARVYAKLEYANPGGSIKDRIGLSMVLEAERNGLLKPGYTIVEPTSGNTGMGLALVAVLRGYKIIFTVPDKMSKDKVDLLRAVGAEVRVTPSRVPPDHPQSYVEVAKKIARNTPHSFMPNQYENLANPRAHYQTTGPEIWEQTEGKVNVLVAGVGTGGTITGTGRYLKEQNPAIRVVGADPVGSILKGAHKGMRTAASPSRIEGIGEDFLPKTLDLSVIDEFVAVTDKQAFDTARRLAKEEGLLAGGSSGAAAFAAVKIARSLGPGETVVVILPDTGRSYINKVYNDDWMAEHGYLKREGRRIPVDAILRSKSPRRTVIRPGDRVAKAILAMTQLSTPSIPVEEQGVQVGSVSGTSLIGSLLRGKVSPSSKVESVMDAPLPTVEKGSMIMDPGSLLRERGTFVVARGSKVVGLITTTDVINYLARG